MFELVQEIFPKKTNCLEHNQCLQKTFLIIKKFPQKVFVITVQVSVEMVLSKDTLPLGFNSRTESVKDPNDWIRFTS